MIRRSNDKRSSLLEALGTAVQAFQEATDEVDEAAGHILGVNRTDLRCLSVLSRVNAISASELADAVGLSRGAMTTALDRIEAAGYARRVPDPDDRRGVRVEITNAARRAASKTYEPIGREGSRLLEKYTTAELASVLRFLEDGAALQRAHARRIRNMRQQPDLPRAPDRTPASRRPGRKHDE
jgi:DNA-binding MarR family transcriptional regulator